MSTMLNQQAGDVAAKLADLKNKIEQGKAEKIRAQTNLETFSKQKDEILKQLAELGITPENLDAEIARLDQETAENLAKAEELLRG